jgi:predicted amino acid dehydrogenase
MSSTANSSRSAVSPVTGNISSAIARWFASPGNWDGPILLLGRAGKLPRLAAFREELMCSTGNPHVQLLPNNADLQSCDLIVVAVSGDQTVIESQHVSAERKVLIADVSQPRAVSGAIGVERPLSTVIQAGLVKLPEDPDFRLTPHTPRGTCFACAAEALLMGLGPQPRLRLSGDVDPAAVETLLQLGRKYGLLESGENR